MWTWALQPIQGCSADEEAQTRALLAWVNSDPDHSEREQREILIGHSAQGRLLLVAFTERKSKIRIVSARKVTRHERRAYEESQKHRS